MNQIRQWTFFWEEIDEIFVIWFFFVSVVILSLELDLEFLNKFTSLRIRFFRFNQCGFVTIFYYNAIIINRMCFKTKDTKTRDVLPWIFISSFYVCSSVSLCYMDFFFWCELDFCMNYTRAVDIEIKVKVSRLSNCFWWMYGLNEL